MFWEFRDVADGVAGQWARLAERLGGAGAPSLEVALRELQLEPVHAPLRASFADGLTVSVMDGVATAAQLREIERRITAFLRAVVEATGVDGDPAPIAADFRERAEHAFAGMARTDEDVDEGDEEEPAADGPHGLRRRDRASLLAWLAITRIGALARGADVAATSLAWYDELRLPSALVGGLHDTGFDEGEAWTVTDEVRVLLAMARPSGIRGTARVAAAGLLEAWLALEITRVSIGATTWEGVDYLERDKFLGLLYLKADAAEAATYRLDRMRELLGPGRTAVKATTRRTGRTIPD